jgi:hypothetical protein
MNCAFISVPFLLPIFYLFTYNKANKGKYHLCSLIAVINNNLYNSTVSTSVLPLVFYLSNTNLQQYIKMYI